MDDITANLQAWSRGDDTSRDALMDAVYSELRRLAGRSLRCERDDHTLQPTDLVHEAFLRLRTQRGLSWQSRRHFFAIAATMMRRVLVDHARSRRRVRRGGPQPTLSLDQAPEPSHDPIDILELDRALRRLATFDRTKARVVDLHFFGGLTVAETAQSLGCSPATVSRHWQTARLWIYRELKGVSDGP